MSFLLQLGGGVSLWFVASLLKVWSFNRNARAELAEIGALRLEEQPLMEANTCLSQDDAALDMQIAACRRQLDGRTASVLEPNTPSRGGSRDISQH